MAKIKMKNRAKIRKRKAERKIEERRKFGVAMIVTRTTVCIAIFLSMFFWSTISAYAQNAAVEKVVIPETPEMHVSCVAVNHSYTLAHYDQASGKLRPVNKDDWRVRCTVTIQKDKIFDGELTIPRPTEWREASDAINDFREKKAQQLAAEWKKKK